MCNRGDTTSTRVLDKSGNLHTVEVDSCIAPLVEALNNHGIRTTGSCCWHKEKFGEIWLADGRDLVIVSESAWVSKMFIDLLGVIHCWLGGRKRERL